jgi:hypothetical protein
MPPHLRELSSAQLDRELGDRMDLVQRPRATPRQVLGGWLENAGVGIGAAFVTATATAILQADQGMIAMAAGVVGAVTFGGMMIWRGSIDERADSRNVRKIQKLVKQLEAQYAAELRKRDDGVTLKDRQLQAAFGEIIELETALSGMTKERNDAVRDLVRERQQARAGAGNRDNYVAPVAVTPQELTDATRMIRHRYDSGKHLSRRTATDATGGWRWSERRWQAALDELSKAGVIVANQGGAEYPATLDEALGRFAEYLLQAHRLSVPAINKTVGKTVYVESDDA